MPTYFTLPAGAARKGDAKLDVIFDNTNIPIGYTSTAGGDRYAANYATDASGRVTGTLGPDGVTLWGGTPPSVTGTRSLAAGDNTLTLNSTSAGAVTLTIPSGLPAGFGLALVQSGAGQVTFAAGGGVTLNNVGTQSKTSGQYAVVTLLQTAADTYVLAGSTGA